MTLPCLAGDNRISYDLSFPLPIGNGSPRGSSLQGPILPFENRFFFSHSAGETYGPVLGIGYGIHVAEYNQPATDTRPNQSFKSRFDSPLLRLGGWFKPQPETSKLIIEATAIFGRGSFDITDLDGNKKVELIANRVDLNFKFILPIAEFNSNSGIDILSGIGFYRYIAPSFKFDGVDYASSELKTHAHLQIGIGYRF